jgi:hypothetical protein
MAYLVDLTAKCRVCGGRASVELRNNHNSSLGFFCARDGKRELRALQRHEDTEAGLRGAK